MNKKEVSEIKKHLNDSDGQFVLNKIVKSYVDYNGEIKSFDIVPYSEIPKDELDSILNICKNILSTQVGKILVEYKFPNNDDILNKDSDKTQSILYNITSNNFSDDSLDRLKIILNKMSHNTANTNAFTFLAICCTYTVFNKTKDDVENEFESNDFNYIIGAICDTNLTELGLVYNNSQDNIYKFNNVEMEVNNKPTLGFMFPTFSERNADINYIMLYNKAYKKNPNQYFIEDVMDCVYTRTANMDKELYHEVINTVLTDSVSFNTITAINDKITNIIAYNKNDTELPVIDKITLKNILLECGVDIEKIKALDNIYDTTIGKTPLIASNIVENKLNLNANDNTIKAIISNDDDTKKMVRFMEIGGKNCIVIETENMTLNGFDI